MFIIDGYNLLHVMRREWPHMPHEWRAASIRLMDLLEAFSLRDHVEVSVYLDHKRAPWGPPELVRPHVRVNFAADADEAIRNHVAASAKPRSITVVSNDREVTSYARACGAKTMPSEGFMKKLGKLAHGPKERSAVASQNTASAPLPPGAKPGPNRRGAKAPDKPHPGQLGDMVADMLDGVGDFQTLAQDAIAEQDATGRGRQLKQRRKG